MVASFLAKLKSTLTTEESLMLKDYFSGVSIPDENDFFPCLMILPKLDGFKGFPFKTWDSQWLDVLSKILYGACVMGFNKNHLARKSDTTWRNFFCLKENVKAEWRVLYKPPLSKKVGICNGEFFMVF